MHAKKVCRKFASMAMAVTLGLTSVIPAYATDGTGEEIAVTQEDAAVALEDAGEEISIQEAPGEDAGSEAGTQEEDTGGESIPGEEGVAVTPIDGYFVFLPDSQEAGFSFDKEREYDETLKGYTVLMYDAGETVSIGVEAEDGFAVTAYDWNVSVVGTAGSGNLTFQMPESDVILVVEDADAAGDGEALLDAIASMEDQEEPAGETAEALEEEEAAPAGEMQEPAGEEAGETQEPAGEEAAVAAGEQDPALEEEENPGTQLIAEEIVTEDTVPLEAGNGDEEGAADEETGTEEEAEDPVSAYPEKGSVEDAGYYRLWSEDADFDYKNFRIYEDDGIIQTYKEGEVNFGEEGEYFISYTCSLADDPEYTWECVVDFEVMADKDMADLGSDEFDNIISMDVNQSGDFEGSVPETMDEVLEGPHYTVRLGDTSFDLEKLNVDYHPDEFNVILKDDGRFDVNTAGDYKVQYLVSSKFYAEYDWIVESTVSVAEQNEKGIDIFVKSQSIEATAYDADGNVLGTARYNQVISSSAVKTLRISSIMDKDIRPELVLSEDGEASDAMGWFTQTGDSAKESVYSLNLGDGAYEVRVSDGIYEKEIEGKAKSSSGWLSSELADMIVSVDGTKATLSNGQVIDITQPDEEIYGGLLDESMELEDTVELNADTRIETKTFSVGKFTGTVSCTNYGWVSNFTGWTKGSVVPSQDGFDKISKWIQDSSYPISMEGISASDLKVTVSCSNPNGSKMGLPYKIRSSVDMKCSVYKTSKDTYYLKVTCSLTKGSDAQGNYQTLTGSKKVKLVEEDPVTIRITKKFENPGLVSYNPRLRMNTVFTIYDNKACGEDDIVGVLEFESATATSLTQEFEAENGEVYYMKETGRINGCRENNTLYTLKPNKDDPSSLKVTVTNYNFVYNGLLLKKVDADTGRPLADAIFKMEYYSRNPDTGNTRDDFKHLGTFYMKTDANGEIRFDADHYVASFDGKASSQMPCDASGKPALTLGWVTFEEVQAPEGFKLDSTRTSPKSLKEPDDKSADTLVYNAPTIQNGADTFSMMLHKVSSENEAGNSHYSLAGAEYELHSSDAFDASDYVATLTIGQDGYSNTVEGLNIDTTYYLKETRAPKNYRIDTTVYRVTGNAMEQKTVELRDEPVKDGEVNIEKYVEEGTVNGGTSGKPGAGIRFELTMEEDSGYYKILQTDEQGKAGIAGLKYGTYTIMEMESVDKYHVLAGPVTFTLDENNRTKDLTKEAGTQIENDYPTPRGLVIEKRDKDTGERIINRSAKFQILDQEGTPVKLYLTNGEKTDIFPMDENGIIRFDSSCGIIGGKYTLVEIECPKGYQKAPDVEFEITADDDQKTVTVTMEDEPVKGRLAVTKIDKVTGLNCEEGFRFNVISADDKTDAAGNVYRGFGRDEVCATITTDGNGIASTEDILYMGKYYVQEVTAGEGYSINRTKYQFEVRSDGKTPEDAVDVELDIANEPTSLKITKADEFHLEKPVAGITFRIKAEGEADADSQLFTTDENGEIILYGLKHSTAYTVQEVKTVPGYNLDSCIHSFAVDGDGLIVSTGEDTSDCIISSRIVPEDWGGAGTSQDDGKGFRIEYVLSNRPNRLEVSKADATNGEEVPGAHLTLTRISSDGDEGNSEVVDEWISDGEPHLVEGLPAGRYRLTEIAAPELYEVAESIEFTLEDSMDIQKQQMMDAPYREAEISKTDITDGAEIEGATLQVLDAENNLVEEWVSGSDGKAEDGSVLPHKMMLPSGVYTLKETVPAPGFVTASSIIFEVLQRNTQGDEEVLEVGMVDDITTLVISKKDITNSEEVPGAHLVIHDKDGNVVEEWDSGEEPHEIKKIPIGEYTLTETTAPDGYEVAETITFIVTDTSEIQHVEMFDSPFREVEVSKMDLTGSEEIEGAGLQITDEEGNVVEEWVSGEDGTDQEGNVIPHTVMLHSGTYTLTETSPADGYVTAESIDFTVSQTTATDFEVQSVQMFDDVTKAEISKQDVTNEKELPGAHLEIKDSDGKVVEKWVSTNEPHYIEELPIGDYVLTETTAPDGYEVSESVKFSIKDTPEIQHVVMYDAPTPGKTSAPQTGDGFPVKAAAAVAGGAILLLGAGFLLVRKKKKH